MCEVGNLIDLTPGEEPGNEETWFGEPEESIVASNSVKGPYDPFDSMEKEACAKGIAWKAQITEVMSVAEAHLDLSSESPPVGMRKDSPNQGCDTPRQRCTSSSFQKQLLKLNASRSAANLPKSTSCESDTPYERTILNENQQMLSAESPLKLVEDDDVASSLKFEQDLKMLRIASLDDHKINTETEQVLTTTEEPPKEGEVSQLLQRLRAQMSVAEAQPDLSSESPAVGCDTPRQRSTSSSFQKQLLKLNATRSAANLPNCESDTPYERMILNDNQQMLSAESPLKLVESDDVASSLKFEQDLQMLRISSLDDHKIDTQPEQVLPPKEGEVSQLLQRLRALVHQVVDKSNWHLFDAIIEPIAALIGPGSGFAHLNPIPSANSPEARQPDKRAALPYTRQGTFDLDLQENWAKEEAAETEEAVPGTKVQDFPDAMTCSAATFDGEPRIPDPAGALTSLNRKEFMTELVDDTLALQINELLERHKLGQSVVGDHEQHGNDPRPLILLVNPTNYGRQAKPNPVPLGVSNDTDSMRRRSSSLSIHDKPKMRKEITKAESQEENQQNVPPRELKNTAALAPFRQRRNSFSTTISNPSTKIGESRRIVLDRMKTPPINESAVVTKPSGNPKAMIPTKRVAPFLKQPAAVPSNEPRQLAVPRNAIVPETPVSLRSKPAPNVFATSTPLPQMRTQQRRSLKPASSSVLANASYTTPSFRRPSFSKKPGTG